MAYIDKEKSSQIKKQLKAEFPDFKFSVTIDNYSSLNCCIMEAPVVFTDSDYSQLNHYHLESYNHSDILQRISNICNEGNHNNSDYITDYFDVGWYFSFNVGKWDKPFKLTESKSGIDWNNYKYVIEAVNSDKETSDADYMTLFDDIEVKKEQTISDEDLQRCTYLEQLANNTLQQLSKWNKVFSDALPEELEDNDFFKVGDYRIEKKSYYAESDIDKFNEFKFTPLYDIKHIKGLWHSTLHRFENMIVNYFNDKYNLRFKSLNIIGDKELGYMANYKEILDYIIKLLDGRTFEDMQHEYTLSDFRKEVRYNPEIKKNTITFNSFCEYRYDDKIKALCKAIGYFEGITIVETRDLISEWNDSRYMLGNTYNLPTNKAVSLKLYQNRRVDLKFTDGQSALDFYNFYDLNNR